MVVCHYCLLLSCIFSVCVTIKKSCYELCAILYYLISVMIYVVSPNMIRHTPGTSFYYSAVHVTDFNGAVLKIIGNLECDELRYHIIITLL